MLAAELARWLEAEPVERQKAQPKESAAAA